MSFVVRREEEERERCEGDRDRLWKRLHRDSGTHAENCSVFLSGISSDCTDLQEIITFFDSLAKMFAEKILIQQ